MTTAVNMNTNFNFRTKFKKLLNDENSGIIQTIFEEFCTYDVEKAISFLWRLTYSPEVAYEQLAQFGLNSQHIQAERLLTFRNELRVQYEALHPDFLKVDFSDKECKAAFEVLKTNTDPIMAMIIHNHCAACIPLEDIDRILFLLKSEKENNQYGGIRSLRFNSEEAAYLMNFHTDILSILEVLFCYEQEKLRSYDDLPFYMSEEGKEVEEKVSEQGRTEEFYQEFKPVTPENILLHRETFETFVEFEDLNLLMVIGTVGFDLNEVMAKKEQIRIFIEAIKELE